jgi:hypothetical protein
MNKLSNKELHILQHTLGLDYKTRPFRNYFITGKGTDDYKYCESLVLKGLMNKYKNTFNELEEEYIYTVTEKGKDAINDTSTF